MKKFLLIALLALLGVSTAKILSAGSQTNGGVSASVAVDVVANNLYVPWALSFAPDGRLYFNERNGRVRVLNPDGSLQEAPVITLDVSEAVVQERGLLGIAVDPAFMDNKYLFVYYTYGTVFPVNLHNKVDRLIVDDRDPTAITATIDTTIVGGIPGANIHDGGRIKFGPDNYLYIGTGDATCNASQDLNSLGGKILKVNRDGFPAPDHPFLDGDARIYSYGSRNVQGLAFDAAGQLYETEHGPTGDCTWPGGSNDEVNIIYSGGNYGWPCCRGTTCRAAIPLCTSDPPVVVQPLRLYVPETAAPSGATFCINCAITAWEGSLFHTTMGFPGNNFARHLHRIKFDIDGVTIREEEILFRPTYGRIRDVIQGPDGNLYMSTCNRDGRASDILSQPGHEDDDKILRIRPL